MKVLKLAAIAQNIEMLLGGFFDSTYNEHRGPIQIVHQIERVRSNQFFEDDAFYQLIMETEFTRGGTFNPYDRALDVVDANTRTWRTTTIGRKIEVAAAARWNNLDNVTLGDIVWATYLHIQTGGDPNGRGLRVLDDSLWQRICDDDGIRHSSEFPANSLEGNSVIRMVTEAIQRLKDVS
jgi:hypothetical protein